MMTADCTVVALIIPATRKRAKSFIKIVTYVEEQGR
jgi:hypothetical protein